MSEMPFNEHQTEAEDQFINAAMQDEVFQDLSRQRDDLLRRQEILEEHEGGITQKFTSEKEAAETRLHLRELFLHDIWDEANGDTGAFYRIVLYRDLQTELEKDPDNEKVRYLFDAAREDLDAYLYDPEYKEPPDISPGPQE